MKFDRFDHQIFLVGFLSHFKSYETFIPKSKYPNIIFILKKLCLHQMTYDHEI